METNATPPATSMTPPPAPAAPAQVSIPETEYRRLVDAQARYELLESERLTDRKSDAMKTALMGVPFANPKHGPSQVERLLADRIESVRDADGKIIVRDKVTGKPAVEAIHEWLGSDEAGHFLSPTTQGGAGSRGGSGMPPTPRGNEGPPPAPKNLGQAVIMRARIAMGLPPLAQPAPGKLRTHGGMVPNRFGS